MYSTTSRDHHIDMLRATYHISDRVPTFVAACAIGSLYDSILLYSIRLIF